MPHLRLNALSANADFWRSPHPDATALLNVVQEPDGDDGLTGIVVELGGHTLMKWTYLTADEVSEVAADVAAYNADPAAGWARLLSEAAAERLPYLSRSLAATAENMLAAADVFDASREYRMLAADLPDGLTELPGTVGAADITESAAGRIVRVSARAWFDEPVSLFAGYVGRKDLGLLRAEVERFNEDPTREFRKLVIDGIHVEVRSTIIEIDSLAARQVRASALLKELGA
jgi:hypothetical protein